MVVRLVLSRKGFDARHGGMASPILPDGTLLPLPIPHAGEQTTLLQCLPSLGGIDPEALLHDLSRGRLDGHQPVHADPQLTPPPGAPPGWRASLGQAGAAASHLCRRGVGRGDLFLFFGWFRQVCRRTGRWSYAPGAPDEHRIFGWLEVEEVLRPGSADVPCPPGQGWLAQHPHLRRADLRADRANTLYLAIRRSGLVPGAAGGGRFDRAAPAQRLTAAEAPGRSLWSLPGWFLPPSGVPSLTYHTAPALWQRRGDRVLLRSARIGQEFVLSLPEGPEPRRWLAALIGGGH